MGEMPCFGIITTPFYGVVKIPKKFIVQVHFFVVASFNALVLVCVCLSIRSGLNDQNHFLDFQKKGQICFCFVWHAIHQFCLV